MAMFPQEVISHILSNLSSEKDFFWSYGVVNKMFLAEVCRLMKRNKMCVTICADSIANVGLILKYTDIAEAVSFIGLQVEQRSLKLGQEYKDTAFTDMTDMSVKVLFRLQCLVTLNLEGCSNLTDEDVQKIFSKGCSSLQRLGLSYCTSLTHESLIAISQTCKELADLNVESVERISDPGIQSISENCKEIRLLNLSGTSITDAALQCISDSSNMIEDLKKNLSKIELLLAKQPTEQYAFFEKQH